MSGVVTGQFGGIHDSKGTVHLLVNNVWSGTVKVFTMPRSASKVVKQMNRPLTTFTYFVLTNC